MKFKKMHDREQNREISRRALIGWMTAAGACLSIPAWKVKEVIEGTHGKAFAAYTQNGARSVSMDFGVGSLAWWTQVFPWVELGQTTNNNHSNLFTGQGRLASGTDNPLWVNPATEIAIEGLEGRKGTMPTLMLAGRAETHTRVSNSTSTLPNGQEVASSNALLQIANTHLLPFLNVSNGRVGAAPGAPGPVQLGNANAMISTFQSAATAAEGILFNKPDAELYDANMTALLKLKKAVDKPTMDKGILAGKISGQVVGLDIAQLITPSPQDRARYGLGVGAGGDNRIQAMATYLMVAEKMIELALVSNFKVQLFNDDPHGAYNNENGSREIAFSIARVMNAFWSKMANTLDPLGTGQTLAEEVTMQVTGDTPKTIFAKGGWGDNPRGGQFTLVWGRGRLRTGQFGAPNMGGQNFIGWNAQNGQTQNGLTSQDTSTVAARAYHYATATEDPRDTAGGAMSYVELPDIDG